MVDLPAFVIDTAPVTNGEYAEFIAAGGYRDRRWWSAAGWAHRTEAELVAPRFWTRDADGGWFRRRFGVVEPVPTDQPVRARVLARGAGLRALGRQAAAHRGGVGEGGPLRPGHRPIPALPVGRRRTRPPQHANLGQRHLSPAPVGAYPAGASPLGVQQLIGDVWEWTSSGWEPYPGFEVFPYPEYSQVFFGGDYRVLRGGSFGTDPAAVRATFRNWDLPIRRQIFAGFRCARDARPADLGGAA